MGLLESVPSSAVPWVEVHTRDGAVAVGRSVAVIATDAGPTSDVPVTGEVSDTVGACGDVTVAVTPAEVVRPPALSKVTAVNARTGLDVDQATE